MNKKQDNKNQSEQGKKELQVVFFKKPRSLSKTQVEKNLEAVKQILQTLPDNTKKEKEFKKMIEKWLQKKEKVNQNS